MTLKDIFDSEFLQNIAHISITDMVLALFFAFLLGLFIFYVYRKSFSGVMYSASFGTALIALALITTILIMTVVSNVVLSLGMVGALSIVRFRTAVKEPMDIVFLFWSISDGIVLAAGLIPLAVFGSLFIGAVLLWFSWRKEVDYPYILMIHCAGADCERQVEQFVRGQVKRLNLKSKSIHQGTTELNYEIRLKKGDSAFVYDLQVMPGVSQIALVGYNGDYMG